MKEKTDLRTPVRPGPVENVINDRGDMNDERARGFIFVLFLRYEIVISYGEKYECAASKFLFILRIFVSYRKIERVSA